MILSSSVFLSNLPIWLIHSLKHLRCVRDFLHPINAGVNHVPIKAVATTPINVATYSGELEEEGP